MLQGDTAQQATHYKVYGSKHAASGEQAQTEQTAE